MCKKSHIDCIATQIYKERFTIICTIYLKATTMFLPYALTTFHKHGGYIWNQEIVMLRKQI